MYKTLTVREVDETYEILLKEFPASDETLINMGISEQSHNKSINRCANEFLAQQQFGMTWLELAEEVVPYWDEIVAHFKESDDEIFFNSIAYVLNQKEQSAV